MLCHQTYHTSQITQAPALQQQRTMKLATTAALTLLHLQPHRISAFAPLSSTIQHHSISLKMSTEATTQQPDVSSFLNGPRPEETKDYIMQQTMVRVKDPVKSLEFYCNILGFRLIHYSEVSEDGELLMARCQFAIRS
jgi:hypothetical protein